jgi:integrase
VGYVITVVGDLPLEQYRRKDAKAVRDYLLAKGNKTGSVRRRLNTIKAVFNVGSEEFELGLTENPFAKVKIPREGQDAEEREGFSQDELAIIGAACVSLDDDIRHIVAIDADTGARLSEIVGLRIEDVVLGADIPHVSITPYDDLGRTLKTKASKRKVPLLGSALWGATRAIDAAGRRGESQGWLFPRYAADNDISGDSASNAINKWLRESLKIDKTTHCFRHAMQTRLKHAGVPKEFRDEIGGWGTRTISDGYGEDFLLRQLREHLEKVILRDTADSTRAQRE